ncbi:hypothetical protein JTE90_027073 [Oedothorax gibbosus]|uniref:Uncharacterized protein n=1 Tax=Oedothorax gibbosus TaxID=931172 RepID=A0AAV6UPC9_9ARAC|nr:hypothetical protein JTE90_027073 [Oedothorax gibbosus]
MERVAKQSRRLTEEACPSTDSRTYKEYYGKSINPGLIFRLTPSLIHKRESNSPYNPGGPRIILVYAFRDTFYDRNNQLLTVDHNKVLNL